MNLFKNRDIQQLFCFVLGGLLFLILSGLLLIQTFSQGYRQDLLSHDAAVSGYLLEHGIPADLVAGAVQSDAVNTKAGMDLLKSIGRTADAQGHFLPEVNTLKARYGFLFFLFFLLFAVYFCTVLFLYFRRQNQELTQAQLAVEAFMSGDETARLNSGRDGSLYRLFHAVNRMATALHTHTEKERRMKDFLKATISDISHQFKTPIAALKLYQEIVGDDVSNETVVREFHSKSMRELERLEALIQTLLKLARLDSDSMTINRRPVALDRLLQERCDAFQTRADIERKEIKLTGPPSCTLLCDPEWLGEAVSNLIKNALDHTSSGGLITVSWDYSPLITQISVFDDGSGIREEDLPHIFKRFYRSKYPSQTQGLGLGLPLVRAIAEAHEGAVRVESDWGKGSLFTIELLNLTKL